MRLVAAVGGCFLPSLVRGMVSNAKDQLAVRETKNEDVRMKARVVTKESGDGVECKRAGM